MRALIPSPLPGPAPAPKRAQHEQDVQEPPAPEAVTEPRHLHPLSARLDTEVAGGAFGDKTAPQPRDEAAAPCRARLEGVEPGLLRARRKERRRRSNKPRSGSVGVVCISSSL